MILKKITICLFYVGGIIWAMSASGIFSYSIQDRIDEYVYGDVEKAHDLIDVLYRIRITDHQKHKQLSEEQKDFVDLVIAYLMDTYIPPREVADDSLVKYVGPNTRYQHVLYTPKDLYSIEASAVVTFDHTLGRSPQLREKVRLPLHALATAYYQRFGTPLYINSARRPYHEQQNTFDQSCFDNDICARPGTSEHQNGLTLDIANMRGEKYLWMKHNAHRYGFHQSYQKGKEIDGFRKESRHWRYLGPTLATQLYESDMSFTQWYREQYGIQKNTQ